VRLLLLSNSTNYGEKYMQWCESTIAFFLGEATHNLVFIPYAAVGFSYDSYTAKVNQALAHHSIQVKGIHSFENKVEAIENASAILVGGGNTFNLLKMLQDHKLDTIIQRVVKKGTPYIGWSAGSNVSGPSICTTNDMPIVEPISFNALNLVSYQINPHYTEATIINHGGESRKQRLAEYLAANPEDRIVCLPESSYLVIKDTTHTYIGSSPGLDMTKHNSNEIQSGSILTSSQNIK
jgi:dipeptidase E